MALILVLDTSTKEIYAVYVQLLLSLYKHVIFYLACMTHYGDYISMYMNLFEHGIFSYSKPNLVVARSPMFFQSKASLPDNVTNY